MRKNEVETWKEGVLYGGKYRLPCVSSSVGGSVGEPAFGNFVVRFEKKEVVRCATPEPAIYIILYCADHDGT